MASLSETEYGAMKAASWAAYQRIRENGRSVPSIIETM
jgi:hypothetical protein